MTDPPHVITNPDPEATVDGCGVSERRLDADWAGRQPLRAPEPEPEAEIA